jgi:quercetin dioxygenase-like cupin family protein
LADFPAATLI